MEDLFRLNTIGFSDTMWCKYHVMYRQHYYYHNNISNRTYSIPGIMLQYIFHNGTVDGTGLPLILTSIAAAGVAPVGMCTSHRKFRSDDQKILINLMTFY